MTIPILHPMISAPLDKPIYCYNLVTGFYCTKHDEKEFPLYNWDGNPGCWYPKPLGWLSREEYLSMSLDHEGNVA